ncbi:hypothetical protein ACFYY1_34190 [Streptomyces sp. NPDC001890]|uniref:hypothetical protein n=1 Tax=Streptomyces sp. NPDC001890 TaxID=3364620 RepID=UPI0036C0A5A9
MVQHWFPRPAHCEYTVAFQPSALGEKSQAAAAPLTQNQQILRIIKSRYRLVGNTCDG